MCDAIVNIYYEIMLEFFSNTIAKPHVKRYADDRLNFFELTVNLFTV